MIFWTQYGEIDCAPLGTRRSSIFRTLGKAGGRSSGADEPEYEVLDDWILVGTLEPYVLVADGP